MSVPNLLKTAMKKRLLALLLIVCFVFAIPCQASAVSSTAQDETALSTISETVAEETVAVEEETQAAENEEDSKKIASDGGNLLKEKVAKVQDEDLSIQSLEDKSTLTSTNASNVKVHYPGEQIYLYLGEDKWVTLCIGYKAFKDVDGNGVPSSGDVYGFITCAHGLYERATNYVYGSADFSDIIGTVYENGYELDTYPYIMDYSFIKLMPGHKVENVTYYAKRKLQGVGRVKKDIWVWGEGATLPNVQTAKVRSLNDKYYVGTHPNYTDINFATTYEGHDLCDAGDSGGIIYQKSDDFVEGTNEIYQVSGIATIDVDNVNNDYSAFTKAESIQDEHNIYVHDGTETNPGSGTSGKCGDNVYWQYYSNTLRIYGTGDMYDYFSAPWSDYYNVIKKVIVEDGVTSIGEYAFYNCSALTEVVIGEDVKRIGYNAFAWCISLVNIEFPKNLNSIGYHAFYRCNELKSVRFFGPRPSMEYAFDGLDLIAYYPQKYTYFPITGGKIKWLIYNAEEGKVSLSVYNDMETGYNYLSWPSIKGANNYIIYYRYSENEEYFKATTTSKTSFLDKSVPKDEPCYYMVKAIAGKEIISDEVCSINYADNVEITVKNDELSGKPIVSWKAKDGSVGNYELYCSKNNSGYSKILDTTFGTSYDHTAAKSDVLYYYRILMFNGSNVVISNPSKGIVCKYAQPTLSVTRETGTGNPKLSWNAVEGATRYEVAYKTDNEKTYTVLPPKEGTTYTHTGADEGVTYYYKVRVANGVGSAYSDAKSIKNRFPTPGWRYITTSSGKVYMQWNSVYGATEYEIHRATSQNGTYTVVGTAKTNEFTDTSAKVGTKYYYKLRVSNGVGSELSGSYVFTFMYSVPSVRYITTNTLSGKPYMEWNPVTGAGSYTVYRSTSKTGTYSVAGTVTVNYFTDNSATVGTTYYYKVKVSNGVGSNFSSIYSTTCKLAKPVVNVSNDEVTGKPIISWNAVSGTHYYIVYYSTSSTGSYTTLGTTSGITYTHSGATTGTTYYYKVRAYTNISSSAISAYSDIKSMSCKYNRPSWRYISYTTGGKPYLVWNPVTGATSYAVYRSTSSTGTYSQLGISESNYFTDNSAVVGTTYYYKVKVYSGVGSALSTAYSRQCKYGAPSWRNITTNSSGKLYLQWNSVTGATKYTVYRATSNNGTYTAIGTSTTTNYTDTNVSTYATYYYKVKVSNGVGSDYSSVKSAMCKLATPVVTVSNDEITGKPVLSWNWVNGTQYYYVYYSTSQNGTYKSIDVGSVSSYTHTSATAGTKYYYKVRAFSSAVSSASSEYSVVSGIACKYATPTISVTSNTAGKPNVTWSSVSGASMYELWCKENSGEWKTISVGQSTSYTHTNATIGNIYRYAVRVYNGAKSGYGYSSTVTCKYAQPTLTVNTLTSSGKPYLSWGAISGAGIYQISYSTAQNGSYSSLAITGNKYYTHTGATAGVTYYYKVKVYNGVGSEYSSVKSAFCKLAQPSVTVVNDASSGKPKLSWGAVSGTHYYIVYYSTSKNGSYSSITTSSTSYTHSSAKVGTTYYYKVRAYTNVNSSAISVEPKAISITCKYATPSWRYISYTTGGKPDLVWNPVSGATQYEVYYSTAQNGTYTKLATVTTNSYSHGSGIPGRTYYYKVRVSNGVGSAFSTISSKTSN